ncbi:MAG: DUF433 domain-containing protein [Rhodothermia bacterium]
MSVQTPSMSNQYIYIGNGVYSLSEVSRLTQISHPKLYRWVKGHAYRSDSGLRRVGPVVDNLYADENGLVVVDFQSLMELRFIDAFRSKGVSMRTIRMAALMAREKWGVRNPLVTERFLTDGRSILVDAKDETGDRHLIDIVSDQIVLRKLIHQYLQLGIEYESGSPVQWWPLGHSGGVVIDPKRSFGAPVVDREGVPTRVLHAAVQSGQSIREVASWYQVHPQSVRKATEYERTLAA